MRDVSCGCPLLLLLLLLLLVDVLVVLSSSSAVNVTLSLFVAIVFCLDSSAKMIGQFLPPLFELHAQQHHHHHHFILIPKQVIITNSQATTGTTPKNVVSSCNESEPRRIPAAVRSVVVFVVTSRLCSLCNSSSSVHIAPVIFSICDLSFGPINTSVILDKPSFVQLRLQLRHTVRPIPQEAERVRRRNVPTDRSDNHQQRNLGHVSSGLSLSFYDGCKYRNIDNGFLLSSSSYVCIRF